MSTEFLRKKYQGKLKQGKNNQNQQQQQIQNSYEQLIQQKIKMFVEASLQKSKYPLNQLNSHSPTQINNLNQLEKISERNSERDKTSLQNDQKLEIDKNQSQAQEAIKNNNSEQKNNESKQQIILHSKQSDNDEQNEGGKILNDEINNKQLLKINNSDENLLKLLPTQKINSKDKIISNTSQDFSKKTQKIEEDDSNIRQFCNEVNNQKKYFDIKILKNQLFQEPIDDLMQTNPEIVGNLKIQEVSQFSILIQKNGSEKNHFLNSQLSQLQDEELKHKLIKHTQLLQQNKKSPDTEDYRFNFKQKHAQQGILVSKSQNQLDNFYSDKKSSIDIENLNRDKILQLQDKQEKLSQKVMLDLLSKNQTNKINQKNIKDMLAKSRNMDQSEITDQSIEVKARNGSKSRLYLAKFQDKFNKDKKLPSVSSLNIQSGFLPQIKAHQNNGILKNTYKFDNFKSNQQFSVDQLSQTDFVQNSIQDQNDQQQDKNVIVKNNKQVSKIMKKSQLELKNENIELKNPYTSEINSSYESRKKSQKNIIKMQEEYIYRQASPVFSQQQQITQNNDQNKIQDISMSQGEFDNMSNQKNSEQKPIIIYKSITPLDDKIFKYGNILDKRKQEQNPQHPKNHLQMTDYAMVHKIENKNLTFIKNLQKQEFKQKEIDKFKQHIENMKRGLGPVNVGSDRWNEKMGLYKKMKEVGNKNELINKLIFQKKIIKQLRNGKNNQMQSVQETQSKINLNNEENKDIKSKELKSITSQEQNEKKLNQQNFESPVQLQNQQIFKKRKSASPSRHIINKWRDKNDELIQQSKGLVTNIKPQNMTALETGQLLNYGERDGQNIYINKNYQLNQEKIRMFENY